MALRPGLRRCTQSFQPYDDVDKLFVAIVMRRRGESIVGYSTIFGEMAGVASLVNWVHAGRRRRGRWQVRAAADRLWEVRRTRKFSYVESIELELSLMPTARTGVTTTKESWRPPRSSPIAAKGRIPKCACAVLEASSIVPLSWGPRRAKVCAALAQTATRRATSVHHRR